MATSTTTTETDVVVTQQHGHDHHHHHHHARPHIEIPASPARIVEPPVTITYVAAALKVLRLAVPIIANSLLSFGINRTVGMAIVGSNFDARSISVAGLGITVYTEIGLSLPLGFGCGVDTLCSQAHGRDPLSPEAGRWLKTGICLTLLLNIPAALLFLFFAEPLLRLLFEASLAADIALFLRCCVPLMLAQSTNVCVGRGFQATKRADIPTIAAAIGTLTYLCTAPWVVPAMGINFYPMCLAFVNVLSICVIFVYALYIDDFAPDDPDAANSPGTPQCRQRDNLIARVDCWNPLLPAFWSDLSVEGAKTFARAGFATALAIVSEWVGVEVMVLFASGFPLQELAALQVAWIVIAIFYGVPWAISSACAAFVGNELGKNWPKHAEFYAEVVQVVTMLIVLVMSALMAGLSTTYNTFFTRDPAVLRILAAANPAMIFYYNIQNFNLSLVGVYRGSGRQRDASIVVCCSLWFIGLPCAYFSGVKNFPESLLGIELDGISRLFLAFGVGYAVEVAVLLHGLTLLPWKQLAFDASAQKKREAEEIVAAIENESN
jgi:Na+-driven multidrug efflux pump